MELVRPSLERLPGYVAALERQWSPATEDPEGWRRFLQRARDVPEALVAAADDPKGEGPPVTLPDGSQVPRLPSCERWMWDGDFAGSINLRWQDGTTDLPPTCLGHIGYAVVPWKQRRGYATQALGAMLPLARATGLPWVAITTNLDNEASQKVVLANGGYLVEEFTKAPAFGGGRALRYRIDLR
jgi:predicted acetyltransferase